MSILNDLELLLSLLVGGAIGALATASHYEQAALRHWAYEKEIAEGREFYAALGMLRHIKPGHADDGRGTTE